MRVDGSVRIEETVDYIDGPGAAGEKERDPWFEADACNACNCESPYDCHCGRIETGEMP